MNEINPQKAFAASLLLCLSGLSNPSLAQDSGTRPNTAFDEQLEVSLVTVDVWVTDDGGRSVVGLVPSDFTLLHDGAQASIQHFSEVRGGILVPSSDADPTSVLTGAAPVRTEPSHVVLYFDRLRTHPSNYGPLLRGVEQLLASEGIESERILVLRQDRELAIEAPFGSSAEELEQALERLGKSPPRGADLESETRLALDAIRDTWDQNQDLAGSASTGLSSISNAGSGPGGAGGGGSPRAVVGGVGSGAGPDACGMFVNQIEPMLDAFTRSRSQRVAYTLENLSKTAALVAGLPGVKVLIYLSDGLDTQPGAAVTTYATQLCPTAASSLLSRSRSESLETQFLELTRQANTNRVTIYSLQASGLQSPGVGQASTARGAKSGAPRVRAAFDSTQRSSQREGMDLIARQTGGRLVHSQNELGAALRGIANDLRHYYSLAFEAPRADPNGHRGHRIEVSVREDSLHARYRQGYLEEDRERWIAQRLEGALNLGITDNPLGIRLGAGEISVSEGGGYLLPFHVMVPVERLTFVPDGDSTRARVTVQILMRNLETSSLTRSSKTFDLEGTSSVTDFADLVLDLELPTGTLVTAVVAQDDVSLESSFVSTTLQTGPDG